jgi:polyhydroxyalkanoate synthesis regulator phasin
MKKSLRYRLAGSLAALAVAVGAGGAIAATQLTPEQRSDAIVADAAEQLGVEASELDAALTKALQNQVDEAVADGRLTEEQGEELKERIAAGDMPLVGLGQGPGGHGHHHGFDLSVAAEFLGLTESELRTALHEDGQTLAEVAEAEGKSVDGLVTVLVSAARERLDAAVEDGRLTEAQRTQMLSGLEERIREAVENGLPMRFGFRGEGPGPAFVPPAGTDA